MAWTSPRTWVSGETLTAALLNVHVRDNLKAIGDAWTSYGTSATILTATTTNPTLGSGSSAVAYYMAAGKLVHFRIQVICGTSGAAVGSGTYKFLLPATPRTGTIAPIGHGLIQDGSGGAASIGTFLWSATTVGYFFLNGFGACSSGVGEVVNNRRYLISGTYEAA